MIIIYECPKCDYLDSEEDMAANHCLDAESHTWS